MKKKTAYTLFGVFFLLSVLFTVAIKNIDVVTYSVTGKEIGFSWLNIKVQNLTGVNLIWYKITDIMGIISIGFGLLFGLAALIELIREKSFAKVNLIYYGLGGIYALLGILYAAFEKISINCRPIIIEANGETEAQASFPSSHTLLMCTIMVTAIIALNRLLSNKSLKIIADIIGSLFILIAILGRLYSGAHWFTDIVASLLISTTLIFLFVGFISNDTKSKHSS